MAIISRQTDLLVAENWKKVYQTFREADFTSYDFETLRKSMIDYIKVYYPEDFNDFTESSEFIALIDLIAFFGQSLAFRTDLNARENFLDTAERRDSILKLARLVNYNPKRSISSSGTLKVDTVTTTENIYDSNGLNLSNLVIAWDEPSNDNWLEQMTIVINACLVNSQVIGRSGNSQVINSIKTDEYSININPLLIPVYKYSATVNAVATPFEIVSATSVDKSYVYENEPRASGIFNFLYKNDNSGNASNNTGFFFYFKQGELSSKDFVITESSPNKIISLEVNSINNTDVWLYSLDSNGNPDELWKAVPTTAGINVVYNNSTSRNLYQINTKAGDQIDLVFGDGSFANIPRGNFRVYYRTNNGLNYKITTDEMQSVLISFNYVSRFNQIETITFRASLRYTVTNAAARESLDDIKQKAPQQFYTQNRMITGEDYNILPYTNFSTVAKAKAINRTSAGLSRYLDMLDTTGKYSSTNIFGQDGVLYRNNYVKTFKFSFLQLTDIRSTLSSTVSDIISGKELTHFYYSMFPEYSIENVGWHLSTVGENTATGYFTNTSTTPATPATIRGVNAAGYKYLRPGSLVKLVPGADKHFNGTNTIVPGPVRAASDRTYMYVAITEILGDGANNGVGNLSNGVGPVTVNINAPTGSIVESVIPVFKNSLNSNLISILSTLIASYKNFGLTYNKLNQSWQIIYSENLAETKFSLEKQSDRTGRNLDASWILRFDYSVAADEYTVSYRGIEYVFHSQNETNFYFDQSVKNYDSKTARMIKDQVKILKTNSSPNSNSPLGYDYQWDIYKNMVGVDGYTNPRSIYVTYADSNNDGVPDNPKLFEFVVDPNVNPASKLVFFKSITGYDYYMELENVSKELIVSTFATATNIRSNLNTYSVGQIFYATSENVFYENILVNNVKTLSNPLSEYIAYYGRQDLYYQYRHNASNNRRIDPSTSNLVDIYILTSTYNYEYRQWIQDYSGTVSKPQAPSGAELSVELDELNNIKAISDSIIFQPAVFKPIFGSKADSNLQATFKIVKNPSLNIGDSDIKTSVVNAINMYFDTANWDFGDAFYFSELSAYLHRMLSPNIASIVIVPKDTSVSFGSLYQINAEPTEIIISAATVNDVEIITAVTAGQLNQSVASSNRSITF